MITSPLVPSTRSVVGLLALLDAPSLFTFLCPFKATNTHSRSAASTNGKSIIPMMDGGDTYAPRRRLPRDDDDDCCRSFLVASLHLTFLSQASRKTFLGKGAPCTVLSANPAPRPLPSAAPMFSSVSPSFLFPPAAAAGSPPLVCFLRLFLPLPLKLSCRPLFSLLSCNSCSLVS